MEGDTITWKGHERSLWQVTELNGVRKWSSGQVGRNTAGTRQAQRAEARICTACREPARRQDGRSHDQREEWWVMNSERKLSIRSHGKYLKFILSEMESYWGLSRVWSWPDLYFKRVKVKSRLQGDKAASRKLLAKWKMMVTWKKWQGWKWRDVIVFWIHLKQS